MDASVRLERLRLAIGKRSEGAVKGALEEVLQMCERKRISPASRQDLDPKKYRAALEPLIGDRAVHFLSALSLCAEEDEDFFRPYGDPFDCIAYTDTAKLHGIVMDSGVVYDMVNDCLEEAYGPKILLPMHGHDASTLPTVVAHMIVAAMDQVLDWAAGSEVFFTDPIAALREIVRFPPIAVSENEIVILYA